MDPSRDVRVLVAAIAVALLMAPQLARAQALGEAGESCRARSDCVEGLRCIENTCQESSAPGCTDDSECEGGEVCSDGACVGARDEEAAGGTAATGESAGEASDGDETGEGDGDEEQDESAGSGRWADFRLGGTHFIGGLTFAPGLTGFWPYGGDLPVWASFFFALKAGVLFNRTELSVELAPVTWVWDFDPRNNTSSRVLGHSYEGNLNSLSFLVNIGGYIRLADNVYWPFRFGLGLSAHELPLENVYMQGRLDLIGIVYHYGHLMFELNLPSIRFHSEFQNIGIWGWLFTLTISYVV